VEIAKPCRRKGTAPKQVDVSLVGGIPIQDKSSVGELLSLILICTGHIEDLISTFFWQGGYATATHCNRGGCHRENIGNNQGDFDDCCTPPLARSPRPRIRADSTAAVGFHWRGRRRPGPAAPPTSNKCYLLLLDVECLVS